MRQSGFSLIELVVAVAVAGVLLSLGLSSFQTMMASTNTKTVSESVLSGLRRARAEAIKRNAPMRFQLVSTLDATCVLSPTSQLWLVTQTNQGTGGFTYGRPAGLCGTAPAIPPDFCTAGVCQNLPYIAFTSSATVLRNITIAAVNAVAANTSVVTFGPLGQILGNVEGSTSIARVNVSSTVAGAKAWQVNVSAANGAIKLCDPALAAGQPLACS